MRGNLCEKSVDYFIGIRFYSNRGDIRSNKCRDPVTVNYLFGESSWPLILVILGSVLMGGLIVGSVGIVRIFNLQKQVNVLKKELSQTEAAADKKHGVEKKKKVQTIRENDKPARVNKSDI